MALLSVDKRKEYFSYLKLGTYNKENIKKFQAKYFTRKSDIDGLYGTNTDKLLRHVYNVTRYTKNFKPSEFKCECGGKYCSGYPSWMKKVELEHIQSIRDYYKRPMQVTCGLRCVGYNRALNGSIQNSLHLTGYAVDFYMSGVTDTLANRKKSIKWIKKRPNHHYTYGNGINSYGVSVSAPYMGNALHTDTQEPPATKPAPNTNKSGYSGKFPEMKLVKNNAKVKADAVKWAKWIAADNDFHYGYGKHAHHNGCYFCGTQKLKKGHGIKNYEHTYCCNPFVGAAWAHGGGDATALKMCQSCNSWDFGTGKGSYHTSALFDNLGHPAKSKLQAGDVLCNGNHVVIYVGDGKIAEASGGDDNVPNSKEWNDSIHVTTLTDGRYKNLPRAYRYNGNVNVTRPIEEGEVSDRVKDLQNFLNWYGNKLTVDGIFGAGTTKAVKAFQKAQSLSQDGIVGQKTIDAMKKVKK